MEGLPPSTSVFPVIITPPTLHTHILLNTVEEQAGIVSNTATLFRMSEELWTEKCSFFFFFWSDWTMGWTTGK